MSIKENYEIGDKVIICNPEQRIFEQEVEIIEVDNHPFEYAQLKVKLFNSPVLPVPEIWISSKWVMSKRIA